MALQAILERAMLADALRARSIRVSACGLRAAALADDGGHVASTAAAVRRVIDAVEQLAPQGFTDVDTILNYEAREAIVRGYATRAGFAARVVARQS